MQTKLLLSMGGRGGVGKTISLVAIADYLRAKGHSIAALDCDTENAGKSSCFSHWFSGKANSLNLRNPVDCDRLLEIAAGAGVPFVLADLPANASGDVAEWWQEVATPETLRELQLDVVAIGTVAPYPGAAESVVDWIATLGSRVTYLIALNRIAFEAAPKPRQDAFRDWFLVQRDGLLLHTIEIPHLHSHAMQALVRRGTLPSKAIQTHELQVLVRQRIKTWRDRIHAELDLTGLFLPTNIESVVPST